MIPKMIALVESKHIRADRLVFEIGDTVDVHTKIQEGDKERIQIFSGIVISRLRLPLNLRIALAARRG